MRWHWGRWHQKSGPFAIALIGPDLRIQAVEYLCSALGSANPNLVTCAADELAVLREPDLVDCIIRALDNHDLRDPICEVLRRIDTPEARAALGEAK